MNYENVQVSENMFTPYELYSNLPGTFGPSDDWYANFTSNGRGSNHFLDFYQKTFEVSFSGDPSPVRYGSY